MMPVALERQHRVDDVLKSARACEGALLGDVTDEQDRDAAVLGQPHEGVRALSNLTDAAGCRRQCGVGNGLDRVDDEDGGIHRVDLTQRGRQARLGGQPQIGGDGAETRGPQAHLLR